MEGYRPEENRVPEGWKRVRLGDVAEIAFSGVDKKTVDGEIPVELCNYTDVFYSRRIHAGMVFMAATATPVEHRRWTLRAGDVLFTKDSETPDEIGIPSYVTEDMPHVLCGYHLALARPRPNVVDGAFLAEALGSNVSKREFARVANGVTRFGLTLGGTASIPILLPPIIEQRAIAAVLDSIDEGIERSEAVIVAMEQLRGSLLHELLTRGVPGWHTEWKDVPGLGTIPADWDVVRLGDVAAVRFSGVDKRTMEGEIPVHLCNYTDVFYNRRIGHEIPFMEATASLEEIRDMELKRGDVLFTKDSETVNEIGIPAFVEQTFPKVLCGYHLGLARPQAELIDGAYLAETFGFEHMARQFSRVANGVTRFGLTLNSTRSLQVPVPSPSEQTVIANTLEVVDQMCNRSKAERETLQKLKTSAADTLLTGRVRVPGKVRL